MHPLNTAFKVTTLFSDRRGEEEVPHRVPACCATLSRKAMLQQRSSG
jgi:hypothetical protein